MDLWSSPSFPFVHAHLASMPKLLSPKVPVLQPILTTTLDSIQTKTSRKHVKTPVKSNPTISSSTASLALVALSHMPVAPSPVASETKLNTFRISSKKFFLTFPHVQTSLSFQEIFDLILRNSTQTLTSVIIAKEPHSDGSPHFHIFLEFQKKFDTKNPKVFDYIFNKHGNYSSVKNFKQTIKYITKHNDYQEFLSDFTTTKNSLTTQMRLILELPKAKPHDLYQLQEETVRNTIFEVSNKIETYHRRFHKRIRIVLVQCEGFFLCDGLTLGTENKLQGSSDRLSIYILIQFRFQ